MSLILQSFFFEQTGCQCPANGRMVLLAKCHARFVLFIIFYNEYLFKILWLLWYDSFLQIIGNPFTHFSLKNIKNKIITMTKRKVKGNALKYKKVHSFQRTLQSILFLEEKKICDLIIWERTTTWEDVHVEDHLTLPLLINRDQTSKIVFFKNTSTK